MTTLAQRTAPQAGSRPRRRRTVLVRVGRVVVAVAIATIVVAAILAAGLQVTTRQLFAAPAGGPIVGRADRPAPVGDGRVVVAVVLGQTGTVASDVLAPFEVFTSSDQFSVYTVAEGAGPVPLTGGTSLVPVFTFDDVDAGRAPRPDVVVVPAVDEPAGDRERRLRDWIVARASGGARVLGVCSGSEVLAATGLLDGHRATSHWSGLTALRAGHPAVDWVGGRRWVADRGITTTAGVSSGIPGALELVRDLAGPAEATRIGRELAYPGWELGAPTRIPEQHFALADLTLGLNNVLPWRRPTVALALTDGVGEIDTAAVLEAYSVSAAARTVAVAATPTITTRHGLVLTATPTRAMPAEVARVVAPGVNAVDAVDPAVRDWAAGRGIAVEPVTTGDGRLGFDAALGHIARHAGSLTARSVAKMVDYPTDHLRLDGRPDPRSPALAALTLVVAVGVGLVTASRSARPSRPSTSPGGTRSGAGSPAGP